MDDNDLPPNYPFNPSCDITYANGDRRSHEDNLSRLISDGVYHLCGVMTMAELEKSAALLADIALKAALAGCIERGEVSLAWFRGEVVVSLPASDPRTPRNYDKKES